MEFLFFVWRKRLFEWSLEIAMELERKKMRLKNCADEGQSLVDTIPIRFNTLQ